MSFMEEMLCKEIKNKVVRMSQGNIGCAHFLNELLFDPNGGMEALATLEDLEILGSRAYQLWNDCCNRNTQQVIEVLALVDERKITKEELCSHIDRPYGTPFDMDEIRAREPGPLVECAKYRIDGLKCVKVGKKRQMDIAYNRIMEYLFRNSADIGKTFMVTVNKVVNNEGVFLEAIKKEVK